MNSVYFVSSYKCMFDHLYILLKDLPSSAHHSLLETVLPFIIHLKWNLQFGEHVEIWGESHTRTQHEHSIHLLQTFSSASLPSGCSELHPFIIIWWSSVLIRRQRDLTAEQRKKVMWQLTQHGFEDGGKGLQPGMHGMQL